MPSEHHLLTAITALALLACGGPTPPPPSALRDPRCADFELDVQRVWNAETKAEIKGRFGSTGVAYAQQTYESVVTRMDDATRDWVMLRESLCNDCLVRGLIPRELYAAASMCYDAALIRQRTAITLFKTADSVIDLGPEGGEGGGRVVGSGTPEEIASLPASDTGQYLRKILDLSG